MVKTHEFTQQPSAVALLSISYMVEGLKVGNDHLFIQEHFSYTDKVNWIIARPWNLLCDSLVTENAVQLLYLSKQRLQIVLANLVQLKLDQSFLTCSTMSFEYKHPCPTLRMPDVRCYSNSRARAEETMLSFVLRYLMMRKPKDSTSHWRIKETHTKLLFSGHLSALRLCEC